MLHRASFVPTALVVLAACNNLTPGDTGSADETTNNPSTDSAGTTEANTPTTGNDQTTDGPTSQTTPPETETTNTTNTTDGDDTTIYEIQKGDISLDAVVTVKGVVVTSQMVLDGTKGAVFVEEPEGGEYSGIMLYLYDEVAAAWDAPVGSIVDITGTYGEFYDNSQLTVMAPADITVTGTGDVPAPVVIAAADVDNMTPDVAEKFEGVLVELDDVTVTNTADVGIGKFQVDDKALISDYFIYPDNSFNNQVGDHYVAIKGPVLYAFNEFQVCPRTLDDLDKDGGGDTDPGETTDTGNDTDTTGGDTEVTVYDLQQGKFQINDQITIDGVIATSGLTFKKDGFFVQEPGGGPFSGIYVYINMNVVDVKAGDELTITGTYDEFFDFSQIKVTSAADVVVTGSAPVPAPAVVKSSDIGTGGPLAEDYEGVLVQVNNVNVTAVVNMFGEFKVDNALLVDDLFIAKADWVNPAVNTKYTSIVGALAYGFDEFKLSPTKPADIKP